MIQFVNSVRCPLLPWLPWLVPMSNLVTHISHNNISQYPNAGYLKLIMAAMTGKGKIQSIYLCSLISRAII